MKIETTSLADMPTELLHELAGAQRTTGPAHTRGEGVLISTASRATTIGPAEKTHGRINIFGNFAI